MRQLKRPAILVAVLLVLVILGTGVMAQRDVTALVRFVHGLDGADAVDIFTGGQLTITGLEFGQASTYVRVPAGNTTLTVAPIAAETPLFSQDVVLQPGDVLTLIVASTDPAQFLVFREDLVAPQIGNGRFTAVHAIPGVDPVDIKLADGRTVIPGIVYGDAATSSSLDLSAAFIYDLIVAPAGGDVAQAILTPDPLELVGGNSYMLVLYGSAANPQSMLLTTPTLPAEGQPSGYVRFVHGLPGVPSVDIRAGDTYLARGLEYGEFSTHVALPEGEYELVLLTTDDQQELLTLSFTVQPEVYVTAVVLAGGEALSVETFPDDVSQIAADTAVVKLISVLGEDINATIALEDGTVLAESLTPGTDSFVTALPASTQSVSLSVDVKGETSDVSVPPQQFYGGVYYTGFLSTQDDQPVLVFAPTSLQQGIGSAPGAQSLPVVQPAPTQEIVQAPTSTPEPLQPPPTEAPVQPVVQPTAAPAVPTARVATDPGVNIQLRQYPDANALSLGLAPSGTVLLVNGRAGAPELPPDGATPTDFVDPVSQLAEDEDLEPAATWLNVTYAPPGGGEIVAWVNAEYVVVREPDGGPQRLADLPAIPSNIPGESRNTSVTPPSPVEDRVTVTVVNLAAGVNLHVRRLPAETGESLVLLPVGTVMELLGINEARTWVFVSYTTPEGGSVEGWANALYVEYQYNGRSTDLAELETRGLLTIVPEDRRGEVRGPVTSTVITPDPLRDAYIGVVTVTSGNNLHLRRFPDANSESLALIPGGTRVLVTARSGDGLWLLVEFEGQEGWVNGQFVTLTFNDRPAELADVPVVEGQTNTLPESTEAAAGQPPVDRSNLQLIEINVDVVQMTGSPGGGTDGLPLITRGTRAYIIADDGSGTYFYVELEENFVRGWIVAGTFQEIND